MNRFDLQKIAETRLPESKVLPAAGYRDGAYYLAGYALGIDRQANYQRLAKHLREVKDTYGTRLGEQTFGDQCMEDALTIEFDELSSPLLAHSLAGSLQTAYFSPPWSPIVR